MVYLIKEMIFKHKITYKSVNVSKRKERHPYERKQSGFNFEILALRRYTS